jgi:methanesulfonate monooxygenase large subunit
MSKTAREWEAPPPISTKDYVSSLVYTDETLFDEELEKVKKSTWKFVCHESEIPEIYDYRCVNHAGIPLIVTRGEDDVIRTFINACSHRSALVLREPSGNAKQWICLFHRWAFNSKGDCIAIPREGAYEESGIGVCQFI